MANTTKLKPRRVNSFNEPSEGNNLWYRNDDQFNRQEWWSWWYQSFFKTQDEYDALPASKTTDNNLYIIVDTHIKLLEYAELILLTPDEIVEELNSASQEYINKYSNENHMSYNYDRYTLMEDAANYIPTYVNNYIFSTNEWTIVWKKRSK